MQLKDNRLEIAPGITFWSQALSRDEQEDLTGEVFAHARTAPFYRPLMPKSGAPFSVEETNFGPLGWMSDRDGYRYQPHHPVTGMHWPPIPHRLITLWENVADYDALPECCLANLYRDGARMGLHQDRDENALDAPVLSVSLGDDAIFRIGGTTRRSPSKGLRLSSGDVVMFGGPARLFFHGIDRVSWGSSALIPGGGRLNLTLRRVTLSDLRQVTRKDARPGG